jgi:hypothetical protein
LAHEWPTGHTVQPALPVPVAYRPVAHCGHVTVAVLEAK